MENIDLDKLVRRLLFVQAPKASWHEHAYV